MGLIWMEYSYVRCLFCSRRKEAQVAHLVQAKGWGRALFAQRIKTLLVDGVWTEAVTPLLPGYVFVYSNDETDRYEALHSLPYVLRVLTYGDGTDVLKGRDLEFADWLWRLKGNIEIMKAAQVGDRVEIIDGVFKQLHGTVIRMDRRRKTVCVLLETKGTPQKLWLAYEIVERRTEGGEPEGRHPQDEAPSSGQHNQ